jgi:hypothetical protein
LFIKVILVQEYSPKEVNIVNPRTAVIRMNSKKDLDEFMKKYNEAIVYSFPKFMVLPYIENKFNEMNQLGFPINKPLGINQFPNKNIPIQPLMQFPNFPNLPPYSNLFQNYINFTRSWNDPK